MEPEPVSPTAPRNDLTAEFVRSILAYDPLTGFLQWKVRADASPRWNGQYAGKRAGKRQNAGYWVITITSGGRCRTYLAHRLAFLIKRGRWPLHAIDHKNLDGCDNRWRNLREASPFQNAHNQPRRRDNTSGFKGVSGSGADYQWTASIYARGESIYLGRFETAKLAAEAYRCAAKLYHGEFARTK